MSPKCNVLSEFEAHPARSRILRILAYRILICIFLPIVSLVMSQHTISYTKLSTLDDQALFVILINVAFGLVLLNRFFAGDDPMFGMLEEWYEASGIKDDKVRDTVIVQSHLDIFVEIIGLIFMVYCIAYAFQSFYRNMGFMFLIKRDVMITMAGIVIMLSVLPAARRLLFISEQKWREL